MLTRMPRFGEANLAAADRGARGRRPRRSGRRPGVRRGPPRVKATGRFLVGSQALGCIKCHTFKGCKAEGVQAIDMTMMTRRLRPRLVPPLRRRPAGVPPRHPDADRLARRQVAPAERSSTATPASRSRRSGSSCPTAPTPPQPYGLGREPMPLVADKEAVIYRNFIQGAGPRAIGVGYPEKANLAFDANDLRLALIWQGASSTPRATGPAAAKASSRRSATTS